MLCVDAGDQGHAVRPDNKRSVNMSVRDERKDFHHLKRSISLVSTTLYCSTAILSVHCSFGTGSAMHRVVVFIMIDMTKDVSLSPWNSLPLKKKLVTHHFDSVLYTLELKAVLFCRVYGHLHSFSDSLGGTDCYVNTNLLT